MQDAILDTAGNANMFLLYSELLKHYNSGHIAAVGSAPYVEETRTQQVSNLRHILGIAARHRLHADFHLDYNLDDVPQDRSSNSSPLIYTLIDYLRQENWMIRNPGRVVTVGHATRLTRFSNQQIPELKALIGDLPIFFVGLPQSDLYMMGRDSGLRGTLNACQLGRDYELPVAISVNNVGNAFTPQGYVDPLSLCVLGAAIYQDGTADGCRRLLVSL